MFGRELAAMLVVALAATGCAQVPLEPTDRFATPPAGNVRISHVLIDEGLAKLRENHYEDASRIFNAGLKFSPDNARLHFLNALTYHLRYLRGESKSGDLAATGYEMALNLEPAFYEAALQLGRFKFEAKQYGDAIKAFQRAVDIDPQSGDGYLGVAMAAYYAHDLTKARAAVEKAVPLMAKSRAATQAEAMIYAGMGDQFAARSALLKFEALNPPDEESDSRLKRRVNQWGLWHAALPTGSTDGGTPPGSYPAPSMPGGAVPPAYPAPSYSPAQPMSGAAPGGATANEPSMPRWSRCDDAASGNSSAFNTSGSYSSGYSSGSSSADETSPLPALPVTCKGTDNPSMALFDVTILRTEDSTSAGHGINLLDGLAYVLSASRQLNDVLTTGQASQPDTRVVTITHTRGGALANTGNSSPNITYSLNIANATDARSEVLAQPSLLALDRQSSTFFSGRNITLGLAGQAGSQGTFTDKPVGVSLSVTPTFIDKDTMLVSVRAARSFIEQVDSSISFGQTMQTSRNAITSNVVLKYGQTLILSGLAEQEIQHQSDGVPVLKDIPALQYLFSHKGVQKFKRSVVVLLTPRKPEDEREIAQSVVGRMHSPDAEKEGLLNKLSKDLKGADGTSPTIEKAYQHALDNKLYLQFRAGDMKPDDWSTSERVERLLKDIGSLIYF